MNAQVHYPVTPGLCCCVWNRDFPYSARLITDPTCSVHGVVAVAEAPKRALERAHALACLAVREHRTEAITWLRRYRKSKKRLADINAQLREIP